MKKISILLILLSVSVSDLTHAFGGPDPICNEDNSSCDSGNDSGGSNDVSVRIKVCFFHNTIFKTILDPDVSDQCGLSPLAIVALYYPVEPIAHINDENCYSHAYFVVQ